MKMRHEYVAHGGVSLGEDARIWAALEPDPKNQRLHYLFETVSYAHGASVQALDSYARVVEVVRANVDAAIEKQWDSLEDEVTAAGVGQLYDRALGVGMRME
jgi:hypothetical protein